MSIDQVLAVVPVSDMERARPWYELLVGRPEDNRPMDTLAEWRVTDRGWIQVFHDPERAASALLNVSVDDLDKHVAELAGRGWQSATSRRRTRVYAYPPSSTRTATALLSSEGYATSIRC